MENFPASIVELYDRVLCDQISRFSVSEKDIILAIRNLTLAYRPVKDWKKCENVPIIAYYDDASYRCAYLHKHAMCYAGVVHYFMHLAMRDSDIRSVLGNKASISICSLGGGPGSDALAISKAFDHYFNFHQCNIRIVDYFQKWENVFMSVIKELRSGRYGIVKETVLPQYINCEYIQANLLESFTPKVKQAIRDADFVSMVKFISAVACCKTEKMVKKIFSCMQPGAYLLFIDNAGGGYLKMIQKAAQKYGMLTIFGPITHFEYSNEAFSLKRYRYTSQSETKVSVQIWLKPLGQFNAECEVLVEPELDFYSYQNSLERYTEPQEPNLITLFRTEISVGSLPINTAEYCQHTVATETTIEEPEVDFYSYQNYIGRDIKQEPVLIAPPRTEISVGSLPINATEYCQHTVATETTIDDLEADFDSYQNYIGRDIEQGPVLIAPPRTEISVGSHPIDATDYYQNSVESENTEEEYKQECCCTII